MGNYLQALQVYREEGDEQIATDYTSATMSVSFCYSRLGKSICIGKEEPAPGSPLCATLCQGAG